MNVLRSILDSHVARMMFIGNLASGKNGVMARHFDHAADRVNRALDAIVSSVEVTSASALAVEAAPLPF